MPEMLKFDILPMEAMVMKYLRQILVIMGFSAMGETLHHWIPIPIPASIYGMILLFLALATGILPKSWVSETGGFLVSILPLLFIVPVVGLLSCWDVVAPNLGAICAIVIVSTAVTFGVAGFATALVQKLGKAGEEDA